MTDTTPEVRTFTAEFSLVSHAKEFTAHVTGPGWSILPGTLVQKGRTVTWQAAPTNYGEYLWDMMETVGAFGCAPTGPKAKLNGHRCPVSY